MRNLKISTIDSIPGETIIEYKGVIFDRVVAGTGLLTEFIASFSDVFGGRSGKMESQMDSLYDNLMYSMTDKAIKVGANAIIGLKIDIDEISGKGMSMLMISGVGTAVRSERRNTITGGGATTSKTAGAITWDCIECGSVNSRDSEFCSQCGEKRALAWKCSICESDNPATMKFCPKCGKRKKESEEIVPASKNDIYDAEELIASADRLKNSREICAYFEKVFSNNDDPEIEIFLNILRKYAEYDRIYGTSKSDTMRAIAGFIRHDMKTFPINRSISEVKCPACQTKQQSNRSACFKCGVLFRDE